MKTKTFNKIFDIFRIILFWFAIIVFVLFVCTVGFYRMYIDEENKYLMNDYLKKEVGK